MGLGLGLGFRSLSYINHSHNLFTEKIFLCASEQRISLGREIRHTERLEEFDFFKLFSSLPQDSHKLNAGFSLLIRRVAKQQQWRPGTG